MKIATAIVIGLASVLALCAEDNPLSSEIKAQYEQQKKYYRGRDKDAGGGLQLQTDAGKYADFRRDHRTYCGCAVSALQRGER